MPDVTDSVGEPGCTNKVHDVAIVQAMLRVVKKGGAPYLGGNYDGAYGKQTKAAINKFQTDFALIKAAGTDKAGKVLPGGETVAKLSAMLPATHKPLHVIENQKTVYIEGVAADATTSKNAVIGDVQLDATFRGKVGTLIETMFNQHKIVLWVTDTGGRRPFAKQMTANSHAGPGESNHQYGRAVDLGFKNFTWVQSNGTLKKDRDWLNTLEATNAAKANAFWDARDALALKAPISLFRLQFERIHLQSFDNPTTSARRSLVKLLNLVGTMTWDSVAGHPNRYKCNLGKGAATHVVGSAKQIWSKQSTVTAAMVAAATGAKVTAIKAAQVAAMKTTLKADFELCEANWKKWVPVP